MTERSHTGLSSTSVTLNYLRHSVIRLKTISKTCGLSDRPQIDVERTLKVENLECVHDKCIKKSAEHTN